MHSSRMRTGRSLTVPGVGVCLPGGSASRGGSASWEGGLPAGGGGVCLPGGVHPSMH